MANRLVDALIKDDSEGLTSTERLIEILIAYRYDDRKTLENGKENRGYGKSYPGMDEFTRVVGKNRQTIERNLSSLSNKKRIARVTIGKPGQRAEYVPIYALELCGESVSHIRHKSKNYQSRKKDESVRLLNEMSLTGVQLESYDQDTISIISNHKYDKYSHETSFRDTNESSYEESVLFLRFKELLPYQWAGYVKYGKNLTIKLRELELLGTSLEAVCAYLSQQNFSNSYAIGGLVCDLLDDLIASKKGNKSLPKGWCGFCEPSTQIFMEASPGVDGKLTNECPSCHPRQIELKERINKRKAETTLDLSSMFRNVTD